MFESEFWHPAVTADVACVDLNIDHDGIPNPYILLVKRKNEPFKGRLALPGGFLDENDEDLESCAKRELFEETNVTLEKGKLHFIKTFSDKDRDPRERVISNLYYTIIDRNKNMPIGKDDAWKADWYDLNSLNTDELAFDHWLLITAVVQAILDEISLDYDYGIMHKNDVSKETKMIQRLTKIKTNLMRRRAVMDLTALRLLCYKHCNKEINDLLRQKLSEVNKKLDELLLDNGNRVCFNQPISFYYGREEHKIYGIEKDNDCSTLYVTINNYRKEGDDKEQMQFLPIDVIYEIGRFLTCPLYYRVFY